MFYLFLWKSIKLCLHKIRQNLQQNLFFTFPQILFEKIFQRYSLMFTTLKIHRSNIPFHLTFCYQFYLFCHATASSLSSHTWITVQVGVLYISVTEVICYFLTYVKQKTTFFRIASGIRKKKKSIWFEHSPKCRKGRLSKALDVFTTLMWRKTRPVMEHFKNERKKRKDFHDRDYEEKCSALKTIFIWHLWYEAQGFYSCFLKLEFQKLLSHESW